MGAVLLAAMAVQDQRMIVDLEAHAARNGRLPLFNPCVHELFDASAGQANDVIVMAALIDLEHGHSVLEMMPRDKTRRLELREHAIDRCQPDVLVGLEQIAVNVLGRKVPARAALQDLKDLQAGQCDLQTGFAKILAFHFVDSPGFGGSWVPGTVRYDARHYPPTN